MEKLTLLLLFMTFSQGDAADDGCPTGWSACGLKCVKFFPQALDWLSAEKHCQTFGGNLASVHSKYQNDLLLNLVPGRTPTWIGGHDTVKEGQFVWSDGSLFDYSNWCSGQPDNESNKEHNLEINYGNRCWNDNSKEAQLAFICARSLF